MIGLYFFGRFVENNCGKNTLADLYSLGAISGGLAGFRYDICRRGCTHLLGASGAVSSIMSYFIYNYPN